MKASYRDLAVWQTAMDISVRVYALTASFPKDERFGLTQQMRRASVSIASNIAEGYGRKTNRQKFSFLENALGSVFELETQLELAARLGFAQAAGDIAVEIKNVGKGINGLMRFLERDSRDHEPLRP